MMAPYQLTPRCTAADAARIAQSNAEAYWAEAWYRMMWPDRTLDSLAASAAERMPVNLIRERAERRHQMVVDLSTGEVAGYARWDLSEALQGEWLEAQTPDVSVEDRARYEEAHAKASWSYRRDLDPLDVPIEEATKRHEPKVPYLSKETPPVAQHLWAAMSRTYILTPVRLAELDYIGVRPTHQRRGVASMLIKSGVDVAERLGVPAALVAMGGKALATYQKHGFEIVEELHQDLRPYGADDSYDTYIMVRPVAPR